MNSQLIRVTVRKQVDDSLMPIKVIESSQQLTKFLELWQEKSETDDLGKKTEKLTWPFSLLLEEAKRSTIWLVNPDGIAAPLTKTLSPAYQLAQAKEFLKFISE